MSMYSFSSSPFLILPPFLHPNPKLSLPSSSSLTPPHNILTLKIQSNNSHNITTTTTTTSSTTSTTPSQNPSINQQTLSNKSSVQQDVHQNSNCNRAALPIKEKLTSLLRPSMAFTALEHIINKFIDPPGRLPSTDPIHLHRYFAPVPELPPTQCHLIHGSLPPCLHGGAYIRNGPNPQFLPPTAPYHLFDGDGMLHSITIADDRRATFCSRHVQTYKYAVEGRLGYPVVPNVFATLNSLAAMAARGALFAARVVAGEFDLANGFGLANTSLGLIGGNLYALSEFDLPYRIQLGPDGDIVTVGRDDFDGELSTHMTAHPKTDPVTGETFAFRCSPFPPFLTYFRFDADGRKQPDVPIFSMPTHSLVHDFAITGKYAIFVDTQIGLRLNPVDLIRRGGKVMVVDKEKVPRIGVIGKYAESESEMRWFDAPGLNILHAINAWEEDDGGTVVMVAPSIWGMERVIERIDLLQATVEMVRIDLKSGSVRRQTVSSMNLEFAGINPAYVGKKNR